MLMINRRKAIAAIIGLALIPCVSLGLAGCSGGGGGQSEESVTYVTSSTIEMTNGSDNRMCNGSLQLTILDAQKRPVSIFSNQSESSSAAQEDTSNDIIVEVDMSVMFNANTYTQVLTQLGATNVQVPTTMSDIFEPGTTIYMQGHDQNGADYTSSAVVIPDENENANTLATNAQWNYDLLNANLPEASQTLQGSILFQVSSQVKDLQLVIISGNNNAAPTDADSVLAGNRDTFVYKIQ